jgi:hypothetical protein
MAGEAPSASLRCNTVTVAPMWKVLPGSCNARSAPCTEARGGPMEPASGERHRAINPVRPAASTRVAQHISRAGADDRPVAGWPWYRALAKVTEFHANWSGSRPRPPGVRNWGVFQQAGRLPAPPALSTDRLARHRPRPVSGCRIPSNAEQRPEGDRSWRRGGAAGGPTGQGPSVAMVIRPRDASRVTEWGKYVASDGGRPHAGRGAPAGRRCPTQLWSRLSHRGFTPHAGDRSLVKARLRCAVLAERRRGAVHLSRQGAHQPSRLRPVDELDRAVGEDPLVLQPERRSRGRLVGRGERRLPGLA